MRTLLIVLAACYVVDSLAFEGRYLDLTVEIAKTEGRAFSNSAQRFIKDTLL
jgi:hypothetical protein